MRAPPATAAEMAEKAVNPDDDKGTIQIGQSQFVSHLNAMLLAHVRCCLAAHLCKAFPANKTARSALLSTRKSCISPVLFGRLCRGLAQETRRRERRMEKLVCDGCISTLCPLRVCLFLSLLFSQILSILSHEFSSFSSSSSLFFFFFSQETPLDDD